MRFLFLHQNFPGQFVHVVKALKAQGHACVAVMHDSNNQPLFIPAEAYEFVEPPKSRAIGDHFVRRAARGAVVADAMLRIKASGFVPDVVIGHAGWGETLFVRDVWPNARLVCYAEFWFSASGADTGFDPEFSGLNTLSRAVRTRTLNTVMAQAVLDADLSVTPTRWQASRFPARLAADLHIVHEGVDTRVAAPDPAATIKVGREPVSLRPGDEVITYVARNLEPYRGFHRFMRALPDILARRPNARAVIVGGDKVSYGSAPPDGQSWKGMLLNEVGGQLDLSRVHFVGRVPRATFVNLMQVSAAHIYLTYPFVLSWSMLEAMAAGALVIGSRTAPVEEVIEHGRNGLLVDFFDASGLADAVVEALESPTRFAAIRAAARQTIVERFDLTTICLPRWLQLVGAG